MALSPLYLSAISKLFKCFLSFGSAAPSSSRVRGPNALLVCRQLCREPAGAFPRTLSEISCRPPLFGSGRVSTSAASLLRGWLPLLPRRWVYSPPRGFARSPSHGTLQRTEQFRVVLSSMARRLRLWTLIQWRIRWKLSFSKAEIGPEPFAQLVPSPFYGHESGQLGGSLRLHFRRRLRNNSSFRCSFSSRTLPARFWGFDVVFLGRAE